VYRAQDSNTDIADEGVNPVLGDAAVGIVGERRRVAGGDTGQTVGARHLSCGILFFKE
jgi:hypothetical protein